MEPILTGYLFVRTRGFSNRCCVVVGVGSGFCWTSVCSPVRVKCHGCKGTWSCHCIVALLLAVNGHGLPDRHSANVFGTVIPPMCSVPSYRSSRRGYCSLLIVGCWVCLIRVLAGASDPGRLTVDCPRDLHFAPKINPDMFKKSACGERWTGLV